MMKSEDENPSPSPLKSMQQSREKQQQQEEEEEEEEEPFKLAPFNPSSDQIQSKALDILKLSSNDVLFDLGCGDGRLLCTAAQKCPGLQCVGIEIDPVFVSRAKERVSNLPTDISSRIDIREDDALKVFSTTTSISKDSTSNNKTKNITDLTLMDHATVLYLFVLPKGINKLMDMLNEVVEKRIQEGRKFRVLSYMFSIHEWEPTIVDKTAKGGCPIYYYEFGPT
jgi:predicted RNA methylase